ncbi:gluconolactonase [Haloactinopolyspora alba]|uniref:Gluconolactonase n=1 Tax=Haloactinopolyspora alba TaxID=648780 RepID=A0A2P8E725_9ACTN|nr:SMP-30/gluconolactonase/LRE family protein [Haloactinopolyspora alba]PSL05271.1 gluconolactonase [Haloactinopolyspora alba]
MTIEVRDSRLAGIVDADDELELVAGGFQFLEGPLWHPEDHFLLFSDMPGDTMRRWTPSDGVTVFRSPSGMANGNAYDAQGRLVTCEHATSRVSRTEPDGTVVTLADRYDGRRLNSPNDVVVAGGGIYFTDPTYGRQDFVGVPREPELPFQGVYRIRADGTLDLLVDDFVQPNGLCFALDEKRLFVNDSERMHIRVFDLLADGTLGEGSVWAVTEGDGDGAPDGLKLDSAGNLYCCGPGGVHVFDVDGASLGVIRTPEPAANFTWGDPDLRTLYVCASTGLYRIRVRRPGLPSVRTALM